MTHESIPYKCPVSNASLKYVPQSDSEYGDIFEENGAVLDKFSQPLTGILVNSDMTIVYPVVREIPQLIGNLAIIGNTHWHEENYSFVKRIQDEVDTYDHLVQSKIEAVEETAAQSLGKPMLEKWHTQQYLGQFPCPPDIWIDAFMAADSQFEAYSYLAPLENLSFLQFGGSGTHAIKALMAGARHAFLLSPIQGEPDLGGALAESMRVSSRFTAIRAAGESIPLEDACMDRIYGGGCLHHTDVSDSLLETSRIMKTGGRAAFVEPRSNPIHRFSMKLTGGARFLGAERSETESPIETEQILDHASFFKDLSIYESGGILRYFGVSLDRLLNIKLPVSFTMKLLRAEKRCLDAVGLRAAYGVMAVLLEK